MRQDTFLLEVLIWAGVGAIVATAFIWPDMFGRDSEKNTFVSMTFALFAYLGAEMWLLVRSEGHAALLAPPFLASIFCFSLGYAVWNLFFVLDAALMPESIVMRGASYETLNRAMVLLLVAAFGMWRGYNFGIGRAMGAAIRRTLDGHRWITTSYRLRVEIVVLLIVVHVASILGQVALGIFGYSAEIDQLHAMASFSQWLDYGSAAGTVALIAITLSYFSGAKGNRQLMLLLMVGLLSWRMLLGLLLGFKGQFMLPLVTVGIAYFVLKRRIPVTMVVATVLAVPLAFAIVEPFRIARHSDEGFQSRNLQAIATTISENAFVDVGQDEGVLLPFQRTSMTWFTAIAIKHRDENGVSEGDPDFLGRIVMSPLHAYVPRFFWSSKPTATVGYWFNVEVLGNRVTDTTSIAMGPVSYLYFVGGGVAVAIGFLIIGVIQRMVITTLTLRAGSGHWLIFICILYPLVMIDSDLGGSLTGILRALPLLWLAQYLLFMPDRQRHE